MPDKKSQDGDQGRGASQSRSAQSGQPDDKQRDRTQRGDQGGQEGEQRTQGGKQHDQQDGKENADRGEKSATGGQRSGANKGASDR